MMLPEEDSTFTNSSISAAGIWRPSEPMALWRTSPVLARPIRLARMSALPLGLAAQERSAASSGSPAPGMMGRLSAASEGITYAEAR